jgi:hypothetical protein
MQAAEVLNFIRRREHDENAKILAFDGVIALSARGIGATIVTGDADFRAIRRYLPVDVLYWS